MRTLTKNIIKTLTVAAVSSLASYAFQYGKQYATRKYTTSFTIARKDSTYAYSLIVKWLIAENLIDIERHCKISTFHDDSTGELSISVPPDGSYYGTYENIKICIKFASTEQMDSGYSRRQNTDSVIVITAFNDKNNTVVSKIKSILDYQYGNELLKIEEERTGRFVLKRRRNIDSIILEPETKRKLLKHLNWWKSAKDTYTKYGITYKTGILLEGPPGTGKSSLAQAIASHLDFSLLSISAGALNGSHHYIKRNMVILIEDIDREIVKAAKRAKSTKNNLSYLEPCVTSSEHDECDLDVELKESDLIEALKSSILGPLMNTLDGVASPEGIVFILSTNHPERLDSALIRAGRIDLRLYLGYFDSDRAIRLGKMFDVSENDTLALGEDIWKEPARLQLELMQLKKNNEV